MMIDERQKKTTEAYRASPFWAWVERQRNTSVDLAAKEARKSKSQHKRIAIQTITPNGDCMHGGCTSERDDVEGERGDGSRPLGQGDL